VSRSASDTSSVNVTYTGVYGMVTAGEAATSATFVVSAEASAGDVEAELQAIKNRAIDKKKIILFIFDLF
jgi:hypothetical protein